MFPSANSNGGLLSPSQSATPHPPLPMSMPVSHQHDQSMPTNGVSIHAINQKGLPQPLASPKLSSHSVDPWSTGLCDCCEDATSCCLTCWCPCVTFGRIAEIIDRGSTSCGVSGALYVLILCVTGCSCLYSCFYRSKLRGQYFLDERPCTDCCVHCCCEGCALCQEYRELKIQGFDMSIGWHGNMERRRQGASVPPSVKSDMKR